MKKSFIGPAWRIGFKVVYNKRILGEASKDEIEALSRVIAEGISKIDKTLTENEICNKLTKKLKIVYTEQLPSLSGAKGLAGGNNIYLNKEDVDEIIDRKKEDLIDKEAYNTIVHEAIHKLKGKISYKGKEIRGFSEGATELISSRVALRNRSSTNREKTYSSNFPESPYNRLVMIMAQLEVIFGKDEIGKFALTKDSSLLDKLEQLVGKKLYEELRKDTNRSSRGKSFGYRKFSDWQNILLTSYFDKEIKNIDNQEEAESFLNKLKKMEYTRLKIKDDSFYKDYYTKCFEQLKTNYPDINEEFYRYQECEFYPTIYPEEKTKRINECMLNFFGIPDNIEEFQKIKLENYKRYELEINDNIFVMLKDQNNEYAVWMMDNEGKIKNISLEKRSGKIIIDEIDEKTFITANSLFDSIDFESQEMQEVPLNVSKKDIYANMLEAEKIQGLTETFPEKIARIFRRQKRLPAISEVLSTAEISDKKPSWVLTDEQKKQALQPPNEKVTDIIDKENITKDEGKEILLEEV